MVTRAQNVQWHYALGCGQVDDDWRYENVSSGGQWVGKTQPHVLDLLRELNIGIYEQYVGGSSSDYGGGFISGMDFVQIAARIEGNAAKVSR